MKASHPKRMFVWITWLATALACSMPAAGMGPVNTDRHSVAIKGYDTVAYHTEGRAVKGKSKYSHKWNDAKWYFTSAGNKDLFAADPERYAPQYGGY